MRTTSRQNGFTITELLVASTVLLIVIAGALTTFKMGLDINDTANQVGDASQNLRAGSNQLMRDLMMAGRIVAAEGIPVPNSGGAGAIKRPGPPGSNLTFSLVADDDGNTELPAIIPGYQLGPTINGSTTDMVTMISVDEFGYQLQGLPPSAGAPGLYSATIADDGSTITVPVTSPWLVGDSTYDYTPMAVGDLVLYQNANGMALQTITAINATTGVISFAAGDWFNLNQRNAAYLGTVLCIKGTACSTNGSYPAAPGTALMRAEMITYYVDNVTTPGTPRLTRVLNCGCIAPDLAHGVNGNLPLALAGVVEDLDLTYDLVDAIDATNTVSVAGITTLPYTDASTGITYTAQMIKKVNLHLGVRSESLSKPVTDYVRDHINTSVEVRSLASIDRYGVQ